MLHTIGRLEDFRQGTSTIVEIEGRSIGIINAGGTLFAVLNVCPHQLAPVCVGEVRGTMLPSEPGELIYGLKDQILACPRHGWEFDLESGKALFGVAKSRVLTFLVTVADDGSVQVEMKARRQKAES